MRSFWKLISPYWRSEDKYKAYGLFVLLILFNLGSVYVAVMLNQWYAEFYNALQELNQALFLQSCLKFLGIALIFVFVALGNYYVASILKFRWRKWLTEHYIARWLSFNTHYRLKFHRTATDNPDQRISQDLAAFSTRIVTLFTSFFTETITLISFMGILWTLSGPLQFTLFGKAIVIPGYMLWALLIYAAVGTYIVYKVGKPIVHLDFEQEKYEANFRYSLVRFREKGEEIAIYRGEKIEEDNLKLSFKDIINNFYRIVKKQMHVNSCVIVYKNLSTLFPYLAAAPMFFSKMITLGVLMQIAQAFGTVKDSLSVLIENFSDIASLRATSTRLIEFSQAMEALEQEETILGSGKKRGRGTAVAKAIHLNPHFNQKLEIENLTLTTPEGKALIANFNLSIHIGEKVLITGRSGLGKTTLLRAISGVWPFGSGTIHIPTNTKVLLVPQRAYLPLGSLREAVLYPNNDRTISEEELLFTLQSCRLEHLYQHLDEIQDWSHHLSLGEQQRIIFVRALLQKPDWLIMDEPTASMDKETESLVYQAILKQLPHATVITIGHAPSLKSYHQRSVDLDQETEIELAMERGRTVPV